VRFADFSLLYVICSDSVYRNYSCTKKPVLERIKIGTNLCAFGLESVTHLLSYVTSGSDLQHWQ
jgi:hypothetical protein